MKLRQMNRIVRRPFWLMTLIWVALVIPATGFSQSSGVKLSVNLPLSDPSFLNEELKNELLPFRHSTLLPRHVRNNPRGFSWLCQKEIAIERKLPVGIWMKVGEQIGKEETFNLLSSIRFRVPLGK